MVTKLEKLGASEVRSYLSSWVPEYQPSVAASDGDRARQLG